MNTVTTQDMSAQIARIKELRDTETEVKAILKPVQEQLEAEENKMIEMLVASDLKSYKTEIGQVVLSARLSIRTPKTPEDREKLFDYLKEKGLYEAMISVNSQTLNSFYRNEFKLAQERGEDGFKIPGLSEETMTPILSFTRAK